MPGRTGPRARGALRAARDNGRNRLLGRLTPANRKLLERELVRVPMALGEVIYKPNQRIEHVYFPDTVVLSFIVKLDGGPSVETAMAGAEGMGGLQALQPYGSSSTLCICQLSGHAQRLKASALRRLMRTTPQFGGLVHQYVVAFIAQVSQTAACNRRHSVSQRCARWLLMTHDRVHGDAPFEMTHAFLSHMLGIRREAVTEAALAFRRGKLISYARGRVTVLDRTGLEAASCECYGTVDRRLRRLYA